MKLLAPEAASAIILSPSKADDNLNPGIRQVFDRLFSSRMDAYNSPGMGTHRGFWGSIFSGYVLVAVLLLAGCRASFRPPAQLPPASAECLRKSVEYLAADEREGRGPGTAGLEDAANYIAGYFRGLGLSPLPGHDSYSQPFTSTSIIGIDESTHLMVGGKRFGAGDVMPLAFSAEKAFAGQVVFVGYGISGAPKQSGEVYDDYAGVNVAGKVALALRFEPHDAQGQSRLDPQRWSEHAWLEKKARVASDHGAAALLIVHAPMHHGSESLDFEATQRLGPPLDIPVLHVRQELAERLLRLARAKDLRTYQKHIDESFSPVSFMLRRVRAEGSVAAKRETYELKNVMAFLPGKGPRSKQYIVVGAHYDHLGRGGPGSLAHRSSEIHNGADDNASGTAAMMEIARLLKHAGPLDRSVLFVAFSGEEKGLLGSRYWVEHSPVPLKSVAAMVNLDMVGRLREQRLLIGGEATSAVFSDILQRADAESPIELERLAMFDNGMAPSDNTSFALRRIPVLFLWTGVHDDYHRPSDDAEKINYDGLQQIAHFTARVTAELASARTIEFSHQVQGPTTAPSKRSTSDGGASLGIVPDYEEQTARGVRISGTTPGSPADQAGLLPGDVITGLGEREIANIYDLTEALNSAEAGQSADVRIGRDGKAVVLKVTLGARRGKQ